MPRQPKDDPFAAIVRALFGRYISDRKIESLRRELIRAGIVSRDEEQAPYDASIQPSFALRNARQFSQALLEKKEILMLTRRKSLQIATSALAMPLALSIWVSTASFAQDLSQQECSYEDQKWCRNGREVSCYVSSRRPEIIWGSTETGKACSTDITGIRRITCQGGSRTQVYTVDFDRGTITAERGPMMVNGHGPIVADINSERILWHPLSNVTWMIDLKRLRATSAIGNNWATGSAPCQMSR